VEHFLELNTMTSTEERDRAAVQLGVRIKLAGLDTYCPITRICHSYEELDKELQSLEERLNVLRDQAKAAFSEGGRGTGVEIRPDMDVGEIWSLLSGIGEEESFLNAFNGMDDSMRREVAEYVLTSCNIFSGNAALFSARYDSASALLK
jgi:hypothetical protein